MNQATKYYTETLASFDIILLGSMALKLYFPKFREANDVDITIINMPFLLNFLSGEEKKELFVMEIQTNEYVGLLEARLKFPDGSYVDIITYPTKLEIELINGVKVAKKQHIIERKKQILDYEIEKKDADILKIKKHYGDLKWLKENN
jgi:hypothetical protein